MKIRITEEQLQRIKLLTENDNIYSQFEAIALKVKDKINTIYTKVTYISVAEILHNEVNIKEILQTVDNLENTLDETLRKVERLLETLPEDTASDIDGKIWQLNRPIQNKINVLQSMLMNLEKLVDYEEEHEGTKAFSDIKPMDI